MFYCIFSQTPPLHQLLPPAQWEYIQVGDVLPRHKITKTIIKAETLVELKMEKLYSWLGGRESGWVDVKNCKDCLYKSKR